MSVDGMVPVSGRGAGCDRGMEVALQLRSPAFKPEQHDARTLLSAVWTKPESWGNPQELRGPKFPGRSEGKAEEVSIFGKSDHSDFERKRWRSQGCWLAVHATCLVVIFSRISFSTEDNPDDGKIQNL